ncbi:hypothetical protein MVEN_01638200 [Mycena venus]|uniref:DUF6818 domain-containing protein n=1 Tax=Mycena venus TaxID=2733690 RepID=A0A8H7CQQ3_9AGAR|nr:hypothetical protein MVEN_01638200 [Mycena venus]
MSEQPPRTPFTPIYAPEFSRDANGNILYRDAQGRWLPYNGPLPNQQQAMPEYTAQQLGHVPLNDKSRGGPNSPIEHAFAPQPEYQFTLRPVQSGTPQAPIPIDPALLPLPGGADLDLRDGPTIANAMGLNRAEKVGGRRRKGKERADPKGKKRQRASSGSDNDSEPVAKRGRPQGSANYGKEDVRKMFDLIAELLPVGQKGWKEVERRYNKWAKQNGRAERPPKALENKYKQYLRQKKPTGSGSCPPEVKRAHEIEDLINQRVGTRELSDSEFDDRSDDGSSDDDIEVVERTAIARRAPTPPLPRKSRARGTDLANKLANAFDPEVQKDRDEACARRSFENTQILTLSQQLRDERATTENLRGENTILRNRIHDVERALERAELRNEMMSFADGRRGRSPRRPRRPRPLGYRSHKRDPGVERVDGKIRCETKYPDGGAMTYWISDPSTDDYDESDEENHNPWDTFDVPHRSRSHHTGSRRPISRRRTPSAGPSRRRISRRRTPTPGPSRLPALLPSPSPPPAPISIPHSANAVDTHVPVSLVTGRAVELVVTPQRGPAVALVISPTKQPNTFNGNK